MEIHVDTIIRLMAVGVSFFVLMMVLAGEVRKSLKLPLAGLLVGGAAYLINSSTFLPVPRGVFPIVDLLSILAPFWIWLFARRLFERDPPLTMLVALGAIFVFSWFISNFIPPIRWYGFLLNHITSLILIADLIYSAISGLSDDLVRKRRLIRIYLPILVGLQAAGILIYELIYGPTPGEPLLQVMNGLVIFALVLFGGLALLRTDPDLLVVRDMEGVPEDAAPDLSPAEKVLHEKLESAIQDGQYRETGLTIQNLAEHLGSPEHRLRALINQKLGHRNFSSFLNGYRINEAKEKLADRELVDLPILTIAMDLGYNSLAPFNRAFRAETGVTPSDFRKSSIDQN